MNRPRVRIENEADGLVIRSAVLEDAKLLTKWWNDGKVMAHAGFPNGLNQSVEKTMEQIQGNTVKLSQRCMIEAGGESVGEMSFRIDEGAAEIGIKICEVAYQNKGIGTKLLQMLIEYLFTDSYINEQMPIHKIILDTNLKNLRAQSVYEKIGFKKIAINENAWKDQLGQEQSSVDYELTREQYEDGVRWICDASEKEKIAETILLDLPDWFGLPDATKEYIEESKKMPFFAYYRDGKYIGFIALKETSRYTAEIYVMGVLKEYHRQKIGEKLFESFVQYANRKKYEYVQVKTVDAGHYEEYDHTRLFYEHMGFRKLECFPTLWDEWNPCLIMIQSVEAAVRLCNGKILSET